MIFLCVELSDCFPASGALPENEFAPVEMTLPLDTEALSQAKSEAMEAQPQNVQLPAEEWNPSDMT